VPAILTDTPDKGLPSASVILPLTTVCANTVGIAKSKQHTISVSFLMQLNFDLKDVYYPKNEFNKEFKLDKQFLINAALFTVYT
jgi:hypothetical protein